MLDEAEASYSKLARMASVYSKMLHELLTSISRLAESRDSTSDNDDNLKLSEMQETLIDGIMGLEGLVRVNDREPFSA